MSANRRRRVPPRTDPDRGFPVHLIPIVVPLSALVLAVVVYLLMGAIY